MRNDTATGADYLPPMTSNEAAEGFLVDEDEDKPFLVWSSGLNGYVIAGRIRDKVEHITASEWVRRTNAGEAIYDRVRHTFSAAHSLGGEEEGAHDREPSMIVTCGFREPTTARTKVPGGIYELVATANAIVLRPHKMEPDSYVEMSNVVTDITEEIRWFLNAKDAYKNAGLAWRRGLLLYGPPGNGKTRGIVQAAQAFSNEARIILIPNINMALQFRDFLSDMPVVCVIEEITEQIQNISGAQGFLNFLDGVDSWPNCLNIATTNYPEKLDANIVDRPSRFDRLFKVDNPDDVSRQLYLSKQLGMEASAQLVRDTKGYSIAYLKELVVQHKLKGIPLEDVLQQCLDRKKLVKNEFRVRDEEVGFGSGR